jgi:hypothetical protein
VARIKHVPAFVTIRQSKEWKPLVYAGVTPMDSLLLPRTRERLENGLQLGSVKQLRLEKLFGLDILLLLRRTPNLSVLFVDRMGVSSILYTEDRVEVPHLQRLHIGDINSLSWLERLKCPRLREFVLLHPPSKALIYGFLGRHPSILSLTFPIGDECWADLEDKLHENLPQATKLTIRYGRDIKAVQD